MTFIIFILSYVTIKMKDFADFIGFNIVLFPVTKNLVSKLFLYKEDVFYALTGQLSLPSH